MRWTNKQPAAGPGLDEEQVNNDGDGLVIGSFGSFIRKGHRIALHTMASAKLLRTANAPRSSMDDTEQLVCQALLDLENNVNDLKYGAFGVSYKRIGVS